MADEEQSHIDLFEHSIEILKSNGSIPHEQLKISILNTDSIQKNRASMKIKIREHMLGDLKRVLSSALNLEIETME